VDLVIAPQQAMMEVSRGLEPRTWAVVSLTGIMALIGSFLVSYTRARAEGLGLDCRVGWFERPQRMVLLIVAGLFGVGPWMSGALMVMVALSFITVGQRMAHVWKLTRGAGMDA
jgi:CDP-diacylglycerol--glycerol-3-phosphate 3-phosphatidyltransferase